MPSRLQWVDALHRLGHKARLALPAQVGPLTWFMHNDGRAPHDTLYIGDPALSPETWRVAIDSANFVDQHAALSGWAASPKGTFLAYATSRSGSGWQVWRVRSLAEQGDLPDVLEDIKGGDIAWCADESGFYYSRLQHPPLGAEGTALNSQQQVFYHRLKTPQQDDRLVFAHVDPLMDASAKLAEDDSMLLISAYRGSDRRRGVYMKDPKKNDLAPTRLAADCQANYQFIGASQAQAYFITTAGAPKGRIVRFNLLDPEAAPTEIVAATPDTLNAAHWVGDSLIVVFIHDAAARVQRFTLQGHLLATLHLPDTCWVTGFAGSQHAMTTYYSVMNSTHAADIYRLQMTPRDWHVTLIFKRDIPADLSEFTTYRAFTKSADGTRVPLIISHRKGLKCHGDCPTRMYGYGGFTLPVYPAFSEPDLLWMAHGGVTVRTPTRGGGEYGEAWHQAGMREHKQNTFDDFVAASRWLIDRGYTRPGRLGIEGTSNGGLLVAVSMLQHPELFGAVLCQVGVLDMLRFARYTEGKSWLTEYGDVNIESQFRALLAYSPVHNVRAGTSYPATLIMTGDHDDNVVPGPHSYKFAAALQAAQAGAEPILLRVSQNTGHGAGLRHDQGLDDDADRLAFFAEILGLSPAATGLKTAL